METATIKWQQLPSNIIYFEQAQVRGEVADQGEHAGETSYQVKQEEENLAEVANTSFLPGRALQYNIAGTLSRPVHTCRGVWW